MKRLPVMKAPKRARGVAGSRAAQPARAASEINRSRARGLNLFGSSALPRLAWRLGLILAAAGWLWWGSDAQAENAFSNLWSYATYAGVDSAAAVADDGTIYFGSWRGSLIALRPDGSRKWSFATDNEIRSAPAIGSDGTIYFGSRDRKCYAVGADGRKRWELTTRGWVDTSPALARDGSAYFGSWDQEFYAVNAAGTLRWHFSTGGPITSSAAIGADGTIYFGSHDKKFYALAPDGTRKWAFGTGGAILSSPAVNKDGTLYFTSAEGCFYALTPEGKLKWRLATGGVTESSPVIGPDGTLYVGVGGSLWGITADGKKKWGGGAGDSPNTVDATPVVLAEGAICSISRDGLLSYVSPDGVYHPKYYLAGFGYGSAAVGPSGALYVADGTAAPGGGFSALRAGAALAKTPWPRFHGNSRNTGNVADTAQ
jgi:outer membrane protein assembly factor BamB